MIIVNFKNVVPYYRAKVKNLKTLIRRSPALMLLVFLLSIVTVSVVTASPISIVTKTNSTTKVYLDPPTINGTVIGVNNTVTVNINISDALEVYCWQAGLNFNPNLLECTGFDEGEFLKRGGLTLWAPGTINNTAGTIEAYGSTLTGEGVKADGSGRLAYATFKVKAPGVSDIHLRDVIVTDWEWKDVAVNITDVYTVLVDTTPHTVVTVSNSTGIEVIWNGKPVTVGSGFYDHAFNKTLKEISFKATGPHPFFSNIAIPKEVLAPPEDPYVWAVIVDAVPLSSEKRTITENATHTSIYFTCEIGLHNVQITTRFMPSTITIALSSNSISLGSNITISGSVTAADQTSRPDVTVAILRKLSGETDWTTLANVTTQSDGSYSYPWEPETAGTYEVKTTWGGDDITLRAESDVETLTVKGAEKGIPLEIVAAAIVVIIIIAAIVVYFVKVRKSKPE